MVNTGRDCSPEDYQLYRETGRFDHIVRKAMGGGEPDAGQRAASRRFPRRAGTLPRWGSDLDRSCTTEAVAPSAREDAVS
jgi:hypothetical protein